MQHFILSTYLFLQYYKQACDMHGYKMIKNLNGTQETISYQTENGIQLYHNKSSFSYPLHWHTALEIILPYKKSYGAVMNSIPFSIHEGEILLIPPGELHALNAPIGFGERLILQADCSHVLNNSEMRSLLNLIRPYYIIKKENDSELFEKLSGLLLEIETEYFERKPFYETHLYSILTDFFVEFGRFALNFSDNEKDMSSYSASINMELFFSVCDYINNNFSRNLTLDEAAEKSGFSKSHFCRFFKKNAGKSFYDYLLHTRISHADILLKCPENSIIDAAMNSGFSSISTFNRVFKQFHNCTPSEYRSMLYKA